MRVAHEFAQRMDPVDEDTLSGLYELGEEIAPDSRLASKARLRAAGVGFRLLRRACGLARPGNAPRPARRQAQRLALGVAQGAAHAQRFVRWLSPNALTPRTHARAQIMLTPEMNGLVVAVAPMQATESL